MCSYFKKLKYVYVRKLIPKKECVFAPHDSWSKRVDFDHGLGGAKFFSRVPPWGGGRDLPLLRSQIRHTTIESATPLRSTLPVPIRRLLRTPAQEGKKGVTLNNALIARYIRHTHNYPNTLQNTHTKSSLTLSKPPLALICAPADNQHVNHEARVKEIR